jgi:hypothetical protein
VHVPNVLQYLRKKVLCGALTNGHDWIFLLVKLDNNYDGASYKQFCVVWLRTIESLNGQVVILKLWPNLIAGILVYWVSLMLIYMIELLIDWMLD